MNILIINKRYILENPLRIENQYLEDFFITDYIDIKKFRFSLLITQRNKLN